MTAVPERLVPGTLNWTLYQYEHFQRYEFFAPRVRGLRVLDAACGMGYGSRILADAGAELVVGTDIAPEAVAYASQHFARPNTRFVTGDAERLSLPDHSFDLAISFETIEHVPHPNAFLHEVHRVLKPGGTFVCSTPNRDFCPSGDIQRVPNPYHLSEMSFDEFRAAFSTYFTIEETYHQSHSSAFDRHIELLREFDRMLKPLRFSKALALENVARRALGREQLTVARPLARELSRAVPGDFVIEPIAAASDAHLTFMFVGRAKG
jgi:ubiquinone/menaquinone biosynthesis C-methylase UbiE